jgi:hypothetical protein
MKHLKLFEAEIKRTFTDWLKDPKAPRYESIYRFEFPSKKVFNLDEGSIDVDNLKEFLQYERGCDICQDIANELDLGIMVGDFEDEDYEEPTLTKKEVEANLDEYFWSWIEQSFKNDMSRFFRLYDLDFEEDEIDKDDFESIRDSFNESKLEQYYTYREYNHSFKILKIEVTGMKDDNIIEGVIETNRELSDDEIESVKDYLTGQCSDGWGEGIEQDSDSKEIYGLKFWINLKVWWMDGYPNWYLKIEK